MISTSMCQLQ